jgi:chaperonin cofactor prefoldin
MSQTIGKVLEEKNVSELSMEIEELKNRVKLLEASMNSLKMKMGRKWV